MKKLLTTLILLLALLTTPVLASSDITPPEITMLGENPTFLDVGELYNDPGVVAVDDIDGDLTGFVITLTNLSSSRYPGKYFVRYEVVDSAGNLTVVQRSVLVGYTRTFLPITVLNK